MNEENSWFSISILYPLEKIELAGKKKRFEKRLGSRIHIDFGKLIINCHDI